MINPRPWREGPYVPQYSTTMFPVPPIKRCTGQPLLCQGLEKRHKHGWPPAAQTWGSLLASADSNSAQPLCSHPAPNLSSSSQTESGRHRFQPPNPVHSLGMTLGALLQSGARSSDQEDRGPPHLSPIASEKLDIRCIFGD